jgi:hypothetical protein
MSQERFGGPEPCIGDLAVDAGEQVDDADAIDDGFHTVGRPDAVLVACDDKGDLVDGSSIGTAKLS